MYTIDAYACLWSYYGNAHVHTKHLIAVYIVWWLVIKYYLTKTNKIYRKEIYFILSNSFLQSNDHICLALLSHADSDYLLSAW